VKAALSECGETSPLSYFGFLEKEIPKRQYLAALQNGSLPQLNAAANSGQLGGMSFPETMK
jgi:hypothetical protein